MNWKIAAAALAWTLMARSATAASPQQCTVRWDRMVKTHQTGARSYQQFMSNCLAGGASAVLPTIDAPDSAPQGATARCQDGTYTASTVRLAACEHHGGVAAFLR